MGTTMEYLINGQEVRHDAAFQAIILGALKQHYDTDEAKAVWKRAHSPHADGECARDELWHYHDGVELTPIEDEIPYTPLPEELDWDVLNLAGLFYDSAMMNPEANR